MAYTKTTWVNDQSPDIDADNLNKMEQGIYDAQFPDGGTEGQLLARTANGRGWVDPPNSAVWGGITGDIEDQTDLQAALSSVGKVDSVNGIEPDAQKNVQVDVEITKQGWDALPSTKYTDDINYYIKDGTNIPQAGVISASGVQYDNTQSGLSADTVQEAVDENASGIATVKSGLIVVASSGSGTITSANGYVNVDVPFTPPANSTLLVEVIESFSATQSVNSILFCGKITSTSTSSTYRVTSSSAQTVTVRANRLYRLY